MTDNQVIKLHFVSKQFNAVYTSIFIINYVHSISHIQMYLMVYDLTLYVVIVSNNQWSSTGIICIAHTNSV